MDKRIEHTNGPVCRPDGEAAFERQLGKSAMGPEGKIRAINEVEAFRVHNSF